MKKINEKIYNDYLDSLEVVNKKYIELLEDDREVQSIEYIEKNTIVEVNFYNGYRKHYRLI